MHRIEEERQQSLFLESTYCEYRNLMLSIAQKYTKDAAASEDVFHNAFICLIRSEKKLQQLSPPKLRAYILLAIRHASIDYLRKERKVKLVDLPDDVLLDLLAKSRRFQMASQAPFQSVELFALIQELSLEEQTLLIGHYIVGLDTKELAEMLDCSHSALRVKLHRVKKRVFERFTSSGLNIGDFINE